MKKKNLFFCITMILMVMIIGLCFIACDNPSDGDDKESNNSSDDNGSNNNDNSDNNNSNNTNDVNSGGSWNITINYLLNNGYCAFENGQEMKVMLLDEDFAVKASAIGTITNDSITVEIKGFTEEGDYYYAIVWNGGSSDGIGIRNITTSHLKGTNVTIAYNGQPARMWWEMYP
jgi:hypothetical protein